MKKPGVLAASVAAASATALSASSSSSSSCVSNSTMRFSNQEAVSSKRNEENPSPSTEKFAPRFDGLRFIETLVTAHR
ncbi:putative serine-rich protein C1E8.05 [Prunus yedoensis var. nudiflora]|uniref:Putative serine-rich protein C1E8.05 n=1 Tax=Prunus yedoensis var. nudiflora TaxID=2094558 RepID=A0A314Y5R0_PRUYE|nr:putative serine-rich protein C1E8.05 [Prunus yedoensis var. nudiflora]